MFNRESNRERRLYSMFLYLHTSKIPVFMAVDLILIVKSNIIIIKMNTDKKIISFYLESSKTRKIDEF